MEVSHLASATQRDWWIRHWENKNNLHGSFLKEEEQQQVDIDILKLLIQTHELETILQSKFPVRNDLDWKEEKP